MFLELLGAFALKAGYLLFSRQLALSCLARIHRLDLTENLACFLHCGSGSKFICRQMKTFPRRRYLDYLSVLEQVVRDAASAAKAGSASLGAGRLKTA